MFFTFSFVETFIEIFRYILLLMVCFIGIEFLFKTAKQNLVCVIVLIEILLLSILPKNITLKLSKKG